MISGLQTVSIEGLSQPLTVNTLINEEEHEITLSCHLVDHSLAKQFIVYDFPHLNWHFIGFDNSCYTAYNCFLIKTEITGSNLYKVQGHYARLLCENEVNQSFTSFSFSFAGINNLFPLLNYQIRPSSDSRLIDSISIPKDNKKSRTISKNYEIEIGPVFCYNLQRPLSFDFKQYNQITVKSKDELSTNQVVSFLIILKSYFEICFNTQIAFNDIVMQSSNGSARLMYDSILNVQPVHVNEESISGDYDKLFQGIIGWMANYEKYKSVIKIILKSIYNTFIDENDIALWHAQALELVFQLNEQLFEKAVEKIMADKRKKERKPNIKEMILVLCDLKLMDEFVSKNTSYISDVKNYRDKLTHNNPEIDLSKGQIMNSRRIIQAALAKSLEYSMNLGGVLNRWDLSIIHPRDSNHLFDNDDYNHLVDIKPEPLLFK